jgi:hypothetical protein
LGLNWAQHWDVRLAPQKATSWEMRWDARLVPQMELH